MSGFPLRVNWLPDTRVRTVEVARAVEAAGFDGLGVTDTPRGLEVYAAVEAALAATDSLRVGPSVTNPVTRRWDVHAAAMRAMAEHGRRGFVGFGTGDSAVRAAGGRPARLAELGACIDAIRAVVDDPLPVLVAASGPRGAALAAEVADGVIAGVGTSGTALRSILPDVDSDRPQERWATLRVAIGGDDAEVADLRRRFLPRAISAARFALGRSAEGKDVPERLWSVLQDGFARYDFGAHGQAGHTTNADLLAGDREAEAFVLDRFAIVGTPEQACARLRGLAAAGFTGAYLSIEFERPRHAVDRLATALHDGGLLP